MKKIIITSCVLASISSWLLFIWYGSGQANTSDPIPQLSCWYASKFEQCVVANRNGSSRSITDFACMASNDPELSLDQIILDEKFKEIQDEQLAFLQWLEADKESALTDPLRIIDDITKNFGPEWVYYKQYKELCNGWILSERLTCTWNIPLVPAGNRIADWGLEGECMELANTNLNIYSLVAYDITKLNKSEVINDNHKEYFQQERTKYDEMLSIMWQILWNTERINPTHYTENPIQ